MYLLHPNKSTYCELLATMPYSEVSTKPSFRLKLSLISMSYRNRTATCSYELYSDFSGTIKDFNGDSYNTADLFHNIKVYINGISLYTAADAIQKAYGETLTLVSTGTVTIPYEEDGRMNKLNLSWTGDFTDYYSRVVNKKAMSASPADNPTVFPTADGGYIRDLQKEPFFKKNFWWAVGGAGNYYDDGYLIYDSIDEDYHLVVPYVPAGAEELRMHFNSIGSITIKNPEEKAYTGRMQFTSEMRENLYKLISPTANGADIYAKSLFNIDFLVDGKYETHSYLSPLYIAVSVTKPTVTGTVVDTNPVTINLTGNPGILIRNASNAQATINAMANTGATLIETGITNGSVTMLNVETYNFEKVESDTFYFHAIDSRNEVNSYALSLPIIEYTAPTANFKGGVISGDGDMFYRVSGNCFNKSFGSTQNEIFVYYRYKLQGADDSEYTDWVSLTDIKFDNETDTYSVEGTISGLDYTQTYVFQASIADILFTINSAEYIAVSIPIFDWSATDFNFNVPVTIMGSKIGGANKILWEGDSQMQANDTIRLSEPISSQMTGIVLVFGSTAGGWITHFVPKIMVDINYGGGQSFFLVSNAGMAIVGTKYLHISDEEITGHVSNVMYDSQNNYPTTASGIVAGNAFFHLMYVIGV